MFLVFIHLRRGDISSGSSGNRFIVCVQFLRAGPRPHSFVSSGATAPGVGAASGATDHLPPIESVSVAVVKIGVLIGHGVFVGQRREYELAPETQSDTAETGTGRA